jgi:hypothetical protein
MDQLAAFRSIREKYSLVKNDYFTFDFKEKLVAYGEAGLLWKTLARRWPGHRNVLMRIRDIRQFLGEERLPADYAPPAKSVGLFDIIGAGRKIYKISRKHK